MKKQLKLLSLLVVIIAGTFSLANKMLFPSVNATYIEGPITQDTVWTLTDSPFVVSNNVTVLSTATLTIEPGVEVRFGGAFWIIVEGRLNAIGTQNNNITFTSNKEQPEPGDWGTIKFIGANQSTLAYCLVKYATNGTTVENGNLVIQNSEISENSQNGITIIKGQVEVEKSTIAKNLAAGISVTGDSQVTIQNNILRVNTDGILLTGNSTSGVNIRQNLVLLNTRSGVQLGANDYSNLVILNNTLSANNYGFYISGNARTAITDNSISYNTVGFFYEQANQHDAHFNDIYGNQYGMDAASNAIIINATYNYWGHESGPHHVTLNPAGKGNPVGGNGENIDFIFFLTAPIGYINQRPVARLLTDKNLVPPNQIVTLIATNSSDDRRVDQYLYDFGDGTNSGWTTLSIFVHKYSSTGTYTAGVTVMDDFGVTNDGATSVQISVEVLTPIDVSLTLSPSTIFSDGQVSITVQASVGASPIENANIKLVSITVGSFASSWGSTNSTGYFTTTFTASNVAQQTNLRIIATASQSGYADGSDYKYLQVLPQLSVQVTADPNSIKSEATSNVTIHVTHNANPISDAAVRISSDSGSFSKETGYTDLNGDLAFIFTAPQTMTQINATIIATATKSGYFEGMDQTKITVNPRTLAVQITASQSTVESEATLDMTVHVSEDANPVVEAVVTVSSNQGGNFSSTGNTDSNGDFIFVFSAPKTTTQVDILVTATATKSGYVDGVGQTNIVVTPPPQPSVVAGLPWTTILLIVIPIIVVVIVAVLIKKGIIVIASE